MLTTSVERLEGVNVKLTVTVPAEDVDAAIEDTIKRISAKIKIPGFRPGKAPRPIIENAVGREYILGEATEQVVDTSYPKALDLELLRPIESPTLEDLDSVVAGEPYTYSAEIQVRPELELSSVSDFEIALPPREATDDDIDGQLEIARERFASLEPVEDRGVIAEDFVLLSFEGTVDGEPYEGNVVDKYLYEMNQGLMPPAFDEGILGMTAGEERRVEFEIPDTAAEEHIGKTAGFDVTVHEIKAKKLPEVDDEFAANVGGFDSVEEMRTDLKNRIDIQKGAAHDRLKERRVREAVAARLEGEIPEAMVMSRRESMMRDFLNMLRERELTPEQYCSAAGVTMDDVEADIAVQAAQSVREDLALEALFRGLDMEVTEADIDEELATVAAATETTAEDARKKWEEMGLMAVVREQVMHRRATLWLLENTAITEEVAAEAPAEDETEAGTKKARKPAAKKTARAKKTETAEEPPADAEVAPAEEPTEE